MSPSLRGKFTITELAILTGSSAFVFSQKLLPPAGGQRAETLLPKFNLFCLTPPQRHGLIRRLKRARCSTPTALLKKLAANARKRPLDPLRNKRKVVKAPILKQVLDAYFVAVDSGETQAEANVEAQLVWLRLHRKPVDEKTIRRRAARIIAEERGDITVEFDDVVEAIQGHLLPSVAAMRESFQPEPPKRLGRPSGKKQSRAFVSEEEQERDEEPIIASGERETRPALAPTRARGFSLEVAG